jgi:hypothetical protein
MKQFIVALVALGLLPVLAWLFLIRRPPEQQGALAARELATRAIEAKRVLVIANPFTQLGKLPRKMRDMEEAGLLGVKAGVGGRIQVQTVWPELKPGVAENPRAVFIDPETTTPLSYLVTTDAFDKLTQQHADCDVIVSLIGLPADLARVECWQKAGGPKFALLLPDLRIIGDRAAIRHSFDFGKLVAFVAARPDAPTAPPAASPDWHAEFERRFVLVKRENLEAMIRNFPKLFPAN